MATLVAYNGTNYNFTTGTYAWQSAASTATQDDPAWTGTNYCIFNGGDGDNAGGVRHIAPKSVDFGDGKDYSVLTECRGRVQFKWDANGLSFPDYFFVRLCSPAWNTSQAYNYMQYGSIIVKPNSFNSIRDLPGTGTIGSTNGLAIVNTAGTLMASTTAFTITADTWYKLFFSMTLSGPNTLVTATITSDDEQTEIATLPATTISSSPPGQYWSVGTQSSSNGSSTSKMYIDNILLVKD